MATSRTIALQMTAVVRSAQWGADNGLPSSGYALLSPVWRGRLAVSCWASRGYEAGLFCICLRHRGVLIREVRCDQVVCLA